MQSAIRWIVVVLAALAFYTGLRMRGAELGPTHAEPDVPRMLAELRAHMESYAIPTRVSLLETTEEGVHLLARFELKHPERGMAPSFLVSWCGSPDIATRIAVATRSRQQAHGGGVTESLGHFVLELSNWPEDYPLTRRVLGAFRDFPYGNAAPPN